MDSFSPLEQEVWNFILEMNRTWTTKAQPEELRNYFHPDMVAITPSDKFRRL